MSLEVGNSPMALNPAHVQLGDDPRTLIEAVSEYARNELLPLDRKWDENETTVAEALPTLCEMGLMSMLVPDALGGLGCAYSTYAAILHEIATYSPSTCVTIGVHSMVGGILQSFAPDWLKEKWLSTWGTPESFGAFALSEAGAGSDAAAVSTRAERVDGGFCINGEKMWITNGLSAGWFLTLVRLHDPSEEDGLLCALMVDGKEPGIERTMIRGKMGIRGSETAVISFNDVFVPSEYLLGDPGRGLAVFLSSLNQGRVGIAAQATGIAEACVAEMVSYAGQREQFGRPIGQFQAVANMLADSAVELAAAKALVWRAARRIEQDQPDRVASSMAKAYASEAANRIAYRAVQVHGGTGYVHECRVEQLYRDARVTTIYEGTTEVQRWLIATGLNEHH